MYTVLERGCIDTVFPRRRRDVVTLYFGVGQDAIICILVTALALGGKFVNLRADLYNIHYTLNGGQYTLYT